MRAGVRREGPGPVPVFTGGPGEDRRVGAEPLETFLSSEVGQSDHRTGRRADRGRDHDPAAGPRRPLPRVPRSDPERARVALHLRDGADHRLLHQRSDRDRTADRVRGPTVRVLPDERCDEGEAEEAKREEVARQLGLEPPRRHGPARAVRRDGLGPARARLAPGQPRGHGRARPGPCDRDRGPAPGADPRRDPRPRAAEGPGGGLRPSLARDRTADRGPPGADAPRTSGRSTSRGTRPAWPR